MQAGYERFIGLSEVGSDTIRRAAAVHSICDLQIEYSLISRGIEREILGTCRSDVALGRLRRALAWPDQRPLKSPERSLSQTDFRTRTPPLPGRRN